MLPTNYIFQSKIHWTKHCLKMPNELSSLDILSADAEDSRKRPASPVESGRKKIPKILLTPPILDLNCPCFEENEKLGVSEPFNVDAEMVRLVNYINKVYKHVCEESSQSKPCYGVKKTTCSAVKQSLDSHVNTIGHLEELLEKFSSKNFFVSTQRDKPIVADHFISLVKTYCSSLSDILTYTKNLSTPTSTNSLLGSLTYHLTTLRIYNGILLHVSQSPANEQSQLEGNVE